MYSPDNQLGGILSLFLFLSTIFHLLGPRKASQSFFAVDTKLARIFLRRVINIFIYTQRPKLFLKDHFWVTIRKFNVFL